MAYIYAINVHSNYTSTTTNAMLEFQIFQLKMVEYLFAILQDAYQMHNAKGMKA